MLPKLTEFKSRLQQLSLSAPNVVALRDQDQEITYEMLWSEIQARQTQLTQLSTRMVALFLENSVDLLLWDLALLFADIPTILLPLFFTHSQLQYCLEISQADLIITQSDFILECQASYEKQQGYWRLKAPLHIALPETTQKLTFTSGTTGQPKAVCLGSEQILTVAQSLCHAIASSQSETHLALMPLAVLLENIGCYAILMRGGSIQLAKAAELGLRGASSVDIQTFAKFIQSSQPQSLILVPQFLALLVEAVSTKLIRAECFRFIAVGGGHVNPELLKKANKLQLPVYQGYGLSECASVVALNTPEANRAGSVGKPLPHVQVKIAEDGEILVANNRCLGYLNHPQMPDPYWPTGDLGHLDQDGFLYIRGRKKHQFITSFGRNVNPEWVEALLSQTGVVGQAFVYGEALPENYALLWPVNTAITNEQIDQIIQHANHQLPDYAQVKHWVRLTEPFSPNNQLATANGRLRRDEIARRFQHVFSA